METELYRDDFVNSRDFDDVLRDLEVPEEEIPNVVKIEILVEYRAYYTDESVRL